MAELDVAGTAPRAATGRLVKLHQVIDEVELDIRARGLEPGDRYDTSQELAKRLGIRVSTANRALQLLAQRGKIIRKPRMGSILAGGGRHGSAAVGEVHLLVRADYMEAEGRYAPEVISGMESELGGVPITLHFLPDHDAAEYVQRTIDKAAQTGDRPAFVLVRASRRVQHIVNASAMAAAVHGGLFDSMSRLPSLNIDNAAAGGLEFDYLSQRGCERIAIFRPTTVTPGDTTFWDSLTDAAASAGWLCGAVAPYRLHADEDEIAEALSHELERAPSHLGVVVGTPELYAIVADVLRSRELDPEGRVHITVDATLEDREAESDVAFIRTDVGPFEQGKRLAEMLSESHGGRLARPRSTVMQPRLIVPTGS